MSKALTPPAWVVDAPCARVDPDLWHPGKGESNSAAKRICNGDAKRGRQPCEFRERCLEWAVSSPDRLDGVWGGTSERERRVLRAERDAA